MWYNALGKTGLKVSALACGSNALRLYDESVAKVVYNYALDSGINLIETGRMYGDGKTEEWIGKAVSHRRREYVLASKCWGHNSYKEAARDIDLSLKALQTNHIDNYRLAPVDSKEVLSKALGRDSALRAIEEAKASGKVSCTGLTGHRPDVLIKALETGRFDTVLFVLSMATYTPDKKRLMELAKDMDVGTMVMRPISHGALPPDKALRFALGSGVDAVLCGMYSPMEVDQNLAIAGKKPTKKEWESLRREAEELSTGCVSCGGPFGLPCACPKGIDVRYIMTLNRFRSKHGLLPTAELQWSTCAEAAKTCDDCRKCEKACPFGLSIVPLVHEAARSR